jgi:hypothetical protein
MEATPKAEAASGARYVAQEVTKWLEPISKLPTAVDPI